MKYLNDILYKSKLLKVDGATNIEISNVVFDSREVRPGALFVAIRGLNTDGHLFVDQAIEKGAIAVVCEEMQKNRSKNVTWVKVDNSSKALGHIASNFFDSPSSKLKVVGITGTNGKTTIATLLHELALKAGEKAGLISTVANKIGEEKKEAIYTTPDAIELNRIFCEMLDKGCKYCFMEVSSHAISQNRIEGIRFAGAVFTNISHDHLDYHQSFDQYLKAKKRFFDLLDNKAFALTNIDDKNGRFILQNTASKKYTYSLKSMADFKGKLIENLASGLQMQIDGIDLWCKLAGEYNAYNLLAIYGTALLLGFDKSNTLKLLSSLEAVEGRFDYFVNKDKIMAIVDYAHTPDALENVLAAISNMRTRNEKVITVIGCGGDRDTEKRPLMAIIAAKYSDNVIFTSDNPRFEDPELIIGQMEKGLDPVEKKKSISITDRLQAIKTACKLAEKNDIILVAGKGHEKYQDVKGEKKLFDDKKILENFLL